MAARHVLRQGPVAHMKLAVIGDVHHAFNEVDTAYFNASDHEAVLFTGDIYNYSLQRGLRAAAELAELEKPALLVPGNHDAIHPAQLAAEISRRTSLIRLTSMGHM
ncbi:MAG TPA: metallophosphoesterase, partial [Polyangiales bacterium]|nr:metallophosphoesterase [Polyangiales bacterium]